MRHIEDCRVHSVLGCEVTPSSCGLGSRPTSAGPADQDAEDHDSEGNQPGDSKKHARLALCCLGIPLGIVFGKACNVGAVFRLVRVHAFLQNGQPPCEILGGWLPARLGNLWSGQNPVKARNTAVQDNCPRDVPSPSVSFPAELTTSRRDGSSTRPTPRHPGSPVNGRNRAYAETPRELAATPLEPRSNGEMGWPPPESGRISCTDKVPENPPAPKCPNSGHLTGAARNQPRRGSPNFNGPGAGSWTRRSMAWQATIRTRIAGPSPSRIPASCHRN